MSDQPMNQEEIDALLAGMGGGDPAAAEPVKPVPGPTAASATVVDQGELDALMDALSAPVASGPPPVEVDQAELDQLLNALGGDLTDEADAAPAAPEPATPSGPLGQNDIDAILANLGGDPQPATPAAPAPVPDHGPLGQDGIDALLAGLDANGAPPAPATAVPTGPLGQDGIDALLAGLDAPAAPSGPLGQDAIDALLNGLTDAPPAVGSKPAVAAVAKPAAAAVSKPAAAAVPPGGKLDQGGIDDLLAALGAEQVTVGATTGDSKILGASGGSKTGLPPVGGMSASRRTLALSTEDLTSLVSKHNAPAVGGEAGDGMIDQGDIDALVKQLGAATGTIEAPKPTMTEELAKHDAAIDQLLGEARNPAANAATMDAIDMRTVLDKPPSTGGLSRGLSTAYTVNVPVLTPPELRGARWLLAAAVLMLAICAGTLVVVAKAVRTLGDELAHERATGIEPSDDYGTDFNAASARLSAPDADQAATGVLFLQRMKKRYPSHEAELALVLARHFRGLGAWKEAAREYAAALDESDAPVDDPRVILERAEALKHLDDRDAAKRQLYALVAAEQRWIGETEPPRPASITDRNRATLVEAHLLLGRLLDGGRDQRVAASEPAAFAGEGHAGSGHAGGGHAAPAAHRHAEGHH